VVLWAGRVVLLFGVEAFAVDEGDEHVWGSCWGAGEARVYVDLDSACVGGTCGGAILRKISIVMDGPLSCFGRKTAAKVEVSRHKATSSVNWSVWTVDNDGCMSDEFARRLNEAQMLERVGEWFTRHKPDFGYRAYLFGSARWGSIRFVPHELAEEVARLIAGFYMESLKGLPDGSVEQ
jgi:hypothetical protein